MLTPYIHCMEMGLRFFTYEVSVSTAARQKGIGERGIGIDRVIQYTDPVDTAAQSAPVSPVRSGEDSGIVSSLSG